MTEIKLPQPDEVSKREKDDAMASYLMMFAAWGVGLPLPIINLIAAFIYFIINKSKSRFVAFHSFQSLLTQLPTTLLNASLTFWLIRILFYNHAKFTNEFWIYAIFVAFINLFYWIFSIVACVQAYKGRMYYFLFFGRIAYKRYFGPDAISLEPTVKENTPPSGF